MNNFPLRDSNKRSRKDSSESQLLASTAIILEVSESNQPSNYSMKSKWNFENNIKLDKLYSKGDYIPRDQYSYFAKQLRYQITLDMILDQVHDEKDN